MAPRILFRLENRMAHPRGMSYGVEIPHIVIKFALHLAGELYTLDLYNTKVSNCNLKVSQNECMHDVIDLHLKPSETI
jgi:hypothetical protein